MIEETINGTPENDKVNKDNKNILLIIQSTNEVREEEKQKNLIKFYEKKEIWIKLRRSGVNKNEMRTEQSEYLEYLLLKSIPKTEYCYFGYTGINYKDIIEYERVSEVPLIRKKKPFNEIYEEHIMLFNKEIAINLKQKKIIKELTEKFYSPYFMKKGIEDYGGDVYEYLELVKKCD